MNTEARRTNAKAKFLDLVAQTRRDQIAGKLPMTEQANAENVAALESAAADLRKSAMTMKGEVTVTPEADGTFYVRIGGAPFLRLPTREAADKRAEAVRRFDAANPNSIPA
jgi:hypothetical protein